MAYFSEDELSYGTAEDDAMSTDSNPTDPTANGNPSGSTGESDSESNPLHGLSDSSNDSSGAGGSLSPSSSPASSSSAESSEQSSVANGGGGASSDGTESDDSSDSSSDSSDSSSDESSDEASYASSSEESSQSDESDTDSDTSDESYHPPVNLAFRRSKRLVARRSGAAGAGAPALAAEAAAEKELLQAKLGKVTAERDLARNEYVQKRDECERFKAERDHLQQQLDEARVAHTRTERGAEEGFNVLGGRTGDAGRIAADMHKVLNRPVTYDGCNDKCHVLDWLTAMLHFLITVGVPVTMYVTTAASYLKGEAMRFWVNRRMQLPVGEHSKWEVFKGALLERFDSENTAASARLKLDELQQGRMPMAKFVQRFDQIVSYIPDMSDADLIHRFLAAVCPEHELTLRNDPLTGQRWTEYAKLRKYALNMFPDAPKSLRSRGPKVPKPPKTDQRPWKRPRTADLLRQGLEIADRSAQEVKDGKVSQQYTFTNSEGRSVQRSSAQRRAIMAARVCGYCYGSDHQADACTARQPAQGIPRVQRDNNPRKQARR